VIPILKDELTRTCPRCSAKPSQKCTGRKGNSLSWFHESRKQKSSETGATALVPVSVSYVPKEPPIPSRPPKPKPSDKPITIRELPGMGIWHARRGSVYLATIYKVRSTSTYIPVVDGYAREPLPTLAQAEIRTIEILEGTK
jgi:hypothetical protein